MPELTERTDETETRVYSNLSEGTIVRFESSGSSSEDSDEREGKVTEVKEDSPRCEWTEYKVAYEGGYSWVPATDITGIADGPYRGLASEPNCVPPMDTDTLQEHYARVCYQFGSAESLAENTVCVLTGKWNKWTKNELVSYCRRLGLKVSGTKEEVARRLARDGVFSSANEQFLYYVTDSGEVTRLRDAMQDESEVCNAE